MRVFPEGECNQIVVIYFCFQQSIFNRYVGDSKAYTTLARRPLGFCVFKYQVVKNVQKLWLSMALHLVIGRTRLGHVENSRKLQFLASSFPAAGVRATDSACPGPETSLAWSLPCSPSWPARARKWPGQCSLVR